MECFFQRFHAVALLGHLFRLRIVPWVNWLWLICQAAKVALGTPIDSHALTLSLLASIVTYNVDRDNSWTYCNLPYDPLRTLHLAQISQLDARRIRTSARFVPQFLPAQRTGQETRHKARPPHNRTHQLHYPFMTNRKPRRDLIDITGQRFGKWQVISYSGKQLWRCRCDCGGESHLKGSALRSLRSHRCRDCGLRERPSKHGEAGTRLHHIWQAMKARCLNPDHPCYEWYGARGITVCQEWQDSYIAFRDWATANGYAGNLTIDRWPDNNGNYEPGNCRWATNQWC